MNRKRKRSYELIGILAAVAILLIFGGVFIFARHHSTSSNATNSNSQSSSSSKPTPNANVPGGSNSGSQSNASAGTPPPSKPTLNKSSGNGPDHTVPVGVTMNFVCNSDAGTSCTVLLTDQANASHVVNLGAQNVASSYGQAPFASWDWTALAGNWSVMAQAKNAAGQIANSDSQPLRVQ